MSGDRPAKEPGGCDCHECGCIFIGEPWHTLCAECAKAEEDRAALQSKGEGQP